MFGEIELKFVCAYARALGILLLIATLGIAYAGNPAYSITEYPSINTATVDGKWTAPDEWTDTPITEMAGNGTGKFGYNIQDFTNLGLEWIIEFFTDNTTDPNDYWEICFDDGNDGGGAPDTDDFMIRIIGHTTLKVYKGTGTGWEEITPDPGEIAWKDSINSSPWHSQPHWILEIVDSSKTAGKVQIPNPPPTGMRIAAYDAGTGKFASWPPGSSANIPNTWGVVSTYSLEPIPEGLSPASAILLSAATLTISGYFYRKNRQKNNK